MIWVSLAITLIEFLMKLPELIEWLKKIMNVIQTLEGTKQRVEVRRFIREMRSQMVYAEKGVSFTGKTPIQVYAEELMARHIGAA